MGLQNVREMIAIPAWYLWWVRRKLVHEEIVPDAYHITMWIHALMTNYVSLPLQMLPLKERVGSAPCGFVKLNVDVFFIKTCLGVRLG